jgi:hypothetical protein
MTYMLCKYQIYDIASRICRQVLEKPSLGAVAALDREIAVEQQKWDKKFLQDRTSSSLLANHRALWNILQGCAHQLYLLLHRPYMLATPGYTFLPSSRERCRSSAETLIKIHTEFYEDPQLRSYKWYINGLGSFYALHGAVILAKFLIDGQNSSDLDSHRLQVSFDTLIIRFEELSARSVVCARSLSLLRCLQYVFLLKFCIVLE